METFTCQVVRRGKWFRILVKGRIFELKVPCYARVSEIKSFGKGWQRDKQGA